MSAREWCRSLAAALGLLTGLNNHLDRYVAAATLPLIVAGLSISDAAGGLLQIPVLAAGCLLGLLLLAGRTSLEADIPRGDQAPAGPAGSVHP